MIKSNGLKLTTEKFRIDIKRYFLMRKIIEGTG